MTPGALCGQPLPVVLLAGATFLALAAGPTAPARHDGIRIPVERQAYLMGTRAVLSTAAATRADGLARLETMLRVLEATEAELSTWRDDSALTGVNRTPVGTPWHASGRLCGLLQELEHWRLATDGAFDPGVGALVAVWGLRGAGTLPTADVLAGALDRTGLRHLRIEPERADGSGATARCRLTRLRAVTLDAGAFGKGEALDRVAQRVNGPDDWMIDLGGQVMVGGPAERPRLVALAHPRDRGRPIAVVRLAAGSLATSGGSERDVAAGGRRIGHVLDPRSGQPAAYDGSVTVWHERGLVADLLSTALYVMGPEEGLRWARVRDVAVCYAYGTGGGGAEPVQLRCSAAFERRFPEM